MYLAAVLGLTIVFPVVSIVLEATLFGTTLGPVLVGKWFVFWALGVRLLAAGIRQVLQPSFTAVTIFEIPDPRAGKLVAEIGFGHISLGLVAALSLMLPNWLVPAGLAGGLYLGLAGLGPIVSSNRGREETDAMATDLFVAMVVGLSVVPAIIRSA